MPRRITPAAFLIHAIHAPARGNVDRVPENSPTTTSSAVMPSENTNRYTNPRNPLRVLATHVSTAANAGAPHGAATIPDVAPSRNTAGYDPPPRPEAHCTSRCGAVTGKTSNIARPNTSKRFPTAKRTHGFEATVPNNWPDSPATSPSSAYSRARPPTYASV